MDVQETKKLYAVVLRYWNIGEIREYTVIKETPKTYVVTDTPDNTRWRAENTVKKSDMEIYDKHFCESYAAAVEYKKQLLKKCIASNEKRIAELKAENQKFWDELAKITES